MEYTCRDKEYDLLLMRIVPETMSNHFKLKYWQKRRPRKRLVNVSLSKYYIRVQEAVDAKSTSGCWTRIVTLSRNF